MEKRLTLAGPGKGLMVKVGIARIRIGKIPLVIDQDKGGVARRETVKAVDPRKNWKEAAEDREKEMEKNISSDFCYITSRQNGIFIDTITLLAFDISGLTLTYKFRL